MREIRKKPELKIRTKKIRKYRHGHTKITI